MNAAGMPLSALLRSPVLQANARSLPAVFGGVAIDHQCTFLCVNERDQDGRSRIERIDQGLEGRVFVPRGEIPARGGVCVSPALTSYELEMTLPLLKRQGISVAILLRTPGTRPLSETITASTVALAAKLDITFVDVEGTTSVTATAAALHAFLHSDALRRSANLLTLNERLAQQEVTPERCQHALGPLIQAELAVIDSMGLVLAGSVSEQARTPLQTSLAAYLSDSSSGSTEEKIDHAGPNLRILAVPVPSATRNETTDLWVVAAFHGSVADSELEGARELLTLSSLALSGWNARRKIEGDFFASARGAILAQLATTPARVPDHLASQALSVGWNLSGWHTVICSRATTGMESADIGLHLKVALKAQGYDVEANRFGEHWLVWETRKSQPSKDEYAKLVDAIERTRGTEGSHVVFGIARPRFGPEGFVASLLEAEAFGRQAGTARGRKVVVDARESEASRLIRSALADPELSRTAARYLAGLTDPKNEHLRLTLWQYLRCESRIAETARVLQLHRNTVIQRLGSIERIFGFSLEEPDVKFALRIALQVTDQQSDAQQVEKFL